MPQQLQPRSAAVDRALERTGVPAVSIAAIKDGAIVYEQAYGFDRLEERRAASSATTYNIASLTKQFTATCILLLAKERQVDVDAPLATYLPKVPQANSVTIRHLLTHTSGYVDYYPLGFADEDKLADTQPDEIIARYGSKPLQFEPGSNWSYSNTGYHMLGRVIEVVSGISFGDFLTTRLFEPVGMTASFFNDPPRLTEAHAFGYTQFGLGPVRRASAERAGWLYSSGGIASTVHDLASWCLAVMEHRVLDAETLGEMMTPQRLTDGTVSPMAMGWFTEPREGRTLVLHSGGLAGFATQIVTVPAERCAVIVLTNAGHFQVGLLAREIFRELTGTAIPPPKTAIDDTWKAELDVLVEWTKRFESGQIDRNRMTASLNTYIDDQHIDDARSGLGKLGTIQGSHSSAAGERGGMSWLKARLTFERGIVDVMIRRTSDGRLAEFSASPIP